MKTEKTIVKTIPIRVEQSDYELLAKTADSLGMRSASEFVRLCVILGLRMAKEGGFENDERTIWKC